MRTDFTDYKFRCSSLGKLMTGVKPNLTENQKVQFADYDLRYKGQGRPLTEKQEAVYFDLGAKKTAKPELSTTTKSYLEQLHKEEFFGKKKEISSKYLDKGIQVEEQSITLYSEVTNQLFIKNKERRENDYITGEADNTQKKIRDIKSSWSLDTYPMYDSKLPNKDYEWQLRGYMELWSLDEAELIYCLVDTPEHLIQDELRRACYSINEMDLPIELEEEIRNNMTFSEIPKELRCRVFEVSYDADAIAQLYAQIKMCRAYMNELSLSVKESLKL